MLTFYKLLIALATTAQASVAPAPTAPNQPLTTATGRPACGNVMSKSRQSMNDCEEVATR